VRGLIAEAHEEQRRGMRLAWAIVENAQGRAVGSTSYTDMSRAHRHVEIGWTWIGQRWWGAGANSEARALLLQHAFERLRVVRVAIKTDLANERSRRAIERLGFRHEGVFRAHRIRPDGTLRGSTWYSMLPTEWEPLQGDLLRRALG
jgi:RimJ/RimL family protein N-acetyltransferase